MCLICDLFYIPRIVLKISISSRRSFALSVACSSAVSEPSESLLLNAAINVFNWVFNSSLNCSIAPSTSGCGICSSDGSGGSGKVLFRIIPYRCSPVALRRDCRDLRPFDLRCGDLRAGMDYRVVICNPFFPTLPFSEKWCHAESCPVGVSCLSWMRSSTDVSSAPMVWRSGSMAKRKQ